MRKRRYDEADSSFGHEESGTGGGEYTFSLQVIPSKRIITPLPEPQVVYLLADITPDRELRAKPRTMMPI